MEPTNHDEDSLRAARLEKLRKIEELGIDPWGQRFDNRKMIASVRSMCNEIQFEKTDGTKLDLPVFSDETPVDYKAWKAEQGEGHEVGPEVRVAGRIILLRTAGKLVFITLRDWTGDIQIAVSKADVGDEAFALIKLFDLGDLIGVDGRLGRTKHG